MPPSSRRPNAVKSYEGTWSEHGRIDNNIGLSFDVRTQCRGFVVDPGMAGPPAAGERMELRPPRVVQTFLSFFQVWDRFFPLPVGKPGVQGSVDRLLSIGLEPIWDALVGITWL